MSTRKRKAEEELRPTVTKRTRLDTCPCPVQHTYLAFLDNQILYFNFKCKNQGRGNVFHSMVVEAFRQAERAGELSSALIEWRDILSTWNIRKNGWFATLDIRLFRPNEWSANSIQNLEM
jgi:hypothetical protein